MVFVTNWNNKLKLDLKRLIGQKGLKANLKSLKNNLDFTQKGDTRKN